MICPVLHTFVLRQCFSTIYHLASLAYLSSCAQTMLQHINVSTRHGCGWGQAMLRPNCSQLSECILIGHVIVPRKSALCIPAYSVSVF